MSKTATLTAPAANEDFLAEVEIKLIKLSSTNEMFRDPGDMKEDGLSELMQSIREMGVLQPVLLRASGNGGYILVAGERRLRACTALGMESIPAFVKIMSEEEAFELQLTENLQRKDVHPMKEAKAFKFLQDNHEWTTQELGMRFGKGETYILQRLKLMSLLPEAQKDFAAGDMTLSQALVIARLEKKDQELLLEDCKNDDGTLSSKRNYYKSVQELEEYISDNITRELAKAPFDTEDATLVPKAGACAACPKRSGAQSKLFADIREKDRCFDPACFERKKALGVLKKVKELVETKPDTIFLEDKGWNAEAIPPEIASFLTNNKIKALKDGNDYHTDSYYSTHKKKITGFCLNGPKAGHNREVYIRGPQSLEKTKTDGSASVKLSANDVKESIERIKDRTKRAAELDEEKIYSSVVHKIQESPFLKNTELKPSKAEFALLCALLLDHADYGVKDRIKKALKLTSSDKGMVVAEAMKKLTEEQLFTMVRIIAAFQYTAPIMHDTGIGVLIAEASLGWNVPVPEIRKEQMEARAKREENAKKRIKELEESIKTKKK